MGLTSLTALNGLTTSTTAAAKKAANKQDQQVTPDEPLDIPLITSMGATNLEHIHKHVGVLRRKLLFVVCNKGLVCQQSLLHVEADWSAGNDANSLFYARTLMLEVTNNGNSEAIDLMQLHRTPNSFDRTVSGERVFAAQNEAEMTAWMQLLHMYCAAVSSDRALRRSHSFSLAFKPTAETTLTSKDIAMYNILMTLVGMQELL